MSPLRSSLGGPRKLRFLSGVGAEGWPRRLWVPRGLGWISGSAEQGRAREGGHRWAWGCSHHRIWGVPGGRALARQLARP